MVDSYYSPVPLPDCSVNRRVRNCSQEIHCSSSLTYPEAATLGPWSSQAKPGPNPDELAVFSHLTTIPSPYAAALRRLQLLLLYLQIFT